jgi:maleate isomerase
MAILPTRGLGLIVSAGNRTVEPYFREFGPKKLGFFVTRIRMGSGGERTLDEIANDAIIASKLLTDAKVNVICLQGTGIMMERGPSGEAELITSICKATSTPTYTATQAVVEALRALAVQRIVLIHPLGGIPMKREQTYLEASGFSVTHAVGLGRQEQSASIPPNTWIDVAKDNSDVGADGFFLSGSNTTMFEAVEQIEKELGKPVVTSVQASLWAGVRRVLGVGNAYEALPPSIGQLFTVG